MKRRIRVIGLGNPILSDDAVGFHVARGVLRRLSGQEDRVDVVEASVGGIELMELMADCRQVIIIDAVQFDELDPGEVIRLDPATLHTSLRLLGPHDINLPTALSLGRRLGYTLPEEIIIYGIQGVDLHTFGEELTPAVAAAVPGVVDRVLGELGSMTG